VVTAAKAAASKGGADTVVLEVGEVLAITDCFVITSGTNTRQVRTIADEIERQVAESDGLKPRRIEGLDDLSWVLMDYGDFVVHIFLDETRQYYDLERLWRDVPRLDWEEPAAGRGAVSGR
jgi:ribosome-associated protein